MNDYKYEVCCMYSDGMTQVIHHADKAQEARVLVSAFRKQGLFYGSKPAIEFWYQKTGADYPDYILRAKERLFDMYN